jgi:branched-chain amino acid transport system permease protein
VVGGLASIPGAIAGAIFIQYVPNIADQISKSAPWAIYGLFLILLMYLMPTGAAGLISKIWHWLTRKSATAPASASAAQVVSQPVGDRQS